MTAKFSPNDFFLLFANCIPVKGHSRSTICDLQRRTYFIVPNSLIEILNRFSSTPLLDALKEFDTKNKQIALSYIEYLQNEELGFITDSPNSFPKMDLQHETPFFINDMIIELSQIVIEQLDNLINQIILLGVPHIEIRMDYQNFNLLNLLLLKIKNTRTRSISIICEYNIGYENDREKINASVDQFPFIEKLIIHSIPANLNKILNQRNTTIIKHTNSILSTNTCGNINQESFVSNIHFFTESLVANNCLNKKITIDAEGNIKNCPSLNESYGNIKNEQLIEVISNEKFQFYGKIRKDEIQVCKDCEFRYVCSDCRANVGDDLYAKPAQCKYNPYTITYEN